MKILKHGNLQPRHFICGICDCEFIANAIEYDQIVANGRLLWYAVACPECGNGVTNSRPVEAEEQNDIKRS